LRQECPGFGMLRKGGAEMIDTDICANCGQHRSFHRSSGGLTFCYATKKRFPRHELCDCRNFHPDVMLSLAPGMKELIKKVEKGEV
jgi:hypothetical protein